MCVVAKVLERCVYNRLIGHIENMISVAQHGFLRGKSRTGQLISVLHRISQNLDSGKQTDILYFDVAKAFDTVNHNLLLKKLQRFGLKDNILTWFKSYLSGRQQRVLVNGEISETSPVSSGVPQGSILGPLLFLIYINDLPKSITSPAVDVSLFADVTQNASQLLNHRLTPVSFKLKRGTWRNGLSFGGSNSTPKNAKF